MRLREIGVDGKGALIRGDGFRRPAERPLDLTEVVEECGLARLDLNGPADELDRSLVPAISMRDHTEQVQRVGIVGLSLENVPIQTLRLPHPSRQKVPGGGI